MDCNKDEAIRAKEIAEKKMQSNDFEGARKIALKGKNLYRKLEYITQMLSICDVHCSAQKIILGSEKDWYGILQVEKSDDEAAIKKQYRRLALILHPDKNQFPGAEGAFKLICEANALLSDPAKKYAYDSKINAWSGSTTNPPNHQTNRSFQENNQYGAQNRNASDGFSSLNRDQNTDSTSVFWTQCPFCKVIYQYLRQYINRCLQCIKCHKSFDAYEMTAPCVSSTSSGNQGSQHVPSKPDIHQVDSSQVDSSQETDPENHENGVQNIQVSSVSGSHVDSFQETNPANRENSLQNISSVSGSQVNSSQETSHENRENGVQNIKAGSQGDASMKSVQPEAGVRKGGCSESIKVASSAENLKTGTEGKKRVRKLVIQYSDDSDTELEHVSYKKADEDYHSRPLKRAQTSEEADVVKHKDGNENKETGADHPKEGLKEKNKSSDKEDEIRGETGSGSSVVEIESSDIDLSSSNDSDTGYLECPDPEFYNFEKMHDESLFCANQFWACYDTFDSMPRFYAKVRKVRSSPFKLHITWLEAVPIHDSCKRWVERELPVGCGSFKLGKPDTISECLSLSHQVHCIKGKKKGSFFIYPRVGEVWALFRDWGISWSSNPENHKEFRYEIVEVLSDFAEGIGIKVAHLEKVSGFVSLFQRADQSESNSFLIGLTELYKFSHCVPSFKLTGTEREGVPVGSFELDPGSLPLNPDDLYFPKRAKIERGYKNPSVGNSLPKYAKERGKSSSTGSS
ncbi:uncharacterized protein LOC125187629 [Salvia hispanica]|uniref:uncharacterized protein LOC125187629 n=1 Tax=Salvia hispanica TaxID=49212 RepID=UPI0020099497|nr:uncharacterized protein LOC125187629 [Salvia hispanica]